MKIKLLRVTAGIVGLALSGLLYFLSREEAPQSVDASARSSDWRGNAPAEEKSRPVISMHPITIDLPPFNSPDTAPEDDLATIELVLLEYARHYQGHPEGENAEITAALMGNNEKHLSFLPASGPFLNRAKQMVDRWGTPYFFHQQSAGKTEIISGGPDRQFYTDDDLIR